MTLYDDLLQFILNGMVREGFDEITVLEMKTRVKAMLMLDVHSVPYAPKDEQALLAQSEGLDYSIGNDWPDLRLPDPPNPADDEDLMERLRAMDEREERDND